MVQKNICYDGNIDCDGIEGTRQEYYGNSDNARHIRHNENYPDCADYIAYYVVSSDKEKTSGGLAENTNQSQARYNKVYHTKHPA